LDPIDYSIGRVVYSRQGRDAGRYYVIVQIVDEQFVTIADGALRKLAKPKLKKRKHLDPKPMQLDAIGEKLRSGSKVFDSEVRNALESLGLNTKQIEQE